MNSLNLSSNSKDIQTCHIVAAQDIGQSDGVTQLSQPIQDLPRQYLRKRRLSCCITTYWSQRDRSAGLSLCHSKIITMIPWYHGRSTLAGLAFRHPRYVPLLIAVSIMKLLLKLDAGCMLVARGLRAWLGAGKQKQ